MNSNHTHGVSATCGYDDLNRLTSVVDANLGGSGTTSYTYDSANNLGTVKYPNNIETQFTYDLLNRVSTASGSWGYNADDGVSSERQAAHSLPSSSICPSPNGKSVPH